MKEFKPGLANNIGCGILLAPLLFVGVPLILKHVFALFGADI